MMQKFNNKNNFTTNIRKVLFSFLLLVSFCAFSEVSSSFKSIGESSESLKVMKTQSKDSSALYAVQSRLHPKRFLSELSLGISPILKGIHYLNTVSIDGDYRFYLNNNIGLRVKYSYFFNTINEEGRQIYERSLNPLELEYAQKQSAFLGLDWAPFYGKTVVLDKIIHFDIYFSALAGATELLRLEKKYFPSASLGGGIVFWWSRRFNTRLELSGLYYKYNVPEFEEELVYEYYSKAYISLGVLF